jgi:hypothetical protein
MRERNAVILTLTLLGVILWIVTIREDHEAVMWSAALGCWLLAYVYAQVTRR